MRADRLLSILLLLQTHTRIPARELARRLEVSERTIHRDMEALSTAGVPVVADRGSSGGWRLLEAYRTTLNGLNEAEIQAVFLAKPLRPLADLGLQDAARAGLLKLLAGLPTVARQHAEEVAQRIYVDIGGWRQPEETLPCLPLLQKAVWSDRALRLAYGRADGASVERVVEPLGLVAKGSVWYLVARVEGGYRTYRVSRITDAKLTGESFTRPADFDLAGYWERSQAEFKANLPRYPATVRIEPALLAGLREASRFARIERVGPVEDDGWQTLDMLFEEQQSAVEYILGYGPRIEVVEPEALREQVVRQAEALLAHYAQHDTSSTVARS